MKHLLLVAALTLTIGFNNQAHAIKTDPVLSDPRGTILVKTDPVLKPHLKNKSFKVDINVQPLLDMATLLEQKGAKVSTRVIESSGVTALEITIDGKRLAPMPLGCDECKIEFEY